MPKIDLTEDLEEAQSSQEPVRITRAAAKRLGSVERDAPPTPKRSQSALSLDTISEDSSTSFRATRSTKKTSPMSPIKEKGESIEMVQQEERSATPRRTRRSSVAAESPGQYSFRTLRRQTKEPSETEDSASVTTDATSTSNSREPRQTRRRTSSNLTQVNLESLNGKNVTFDESPEREKERTQFPKTPITQKQKRTEDKETDTSFENVQDKQVPEVTSTESAQETEKNCAVAESETAEDVAVSETVKEADKNAEESDKGDKEEGMEKNSDEIAGAAVEEFSTSWTQPVTGKSTDEVPIDAFGEKERKQEEEKLQEHAEKVAKEVAEYKLVKIYSDEEEEEEEDEGKEKSDFVDDEAIEVVESDESMDPEEREYLRQQEIPEDGIDIGSEDTDTDQGDEDEPTVDDINFIGFSDEEDLYEKEDSLDELVEQVKKKTRKRIREIEDSSDEEIQPPAETYKNSSLLKFSGASLEKLLEEDERDKAVIEADFDQDITMASLSLTENRKKTPQTTPKTTPVKRNLETNIQRTPQKNETPKVPEVKAKTPEKPQEMEQDEPEQSSASEKEEDSENWEDIEEEEEEEAPKDNAKISAVMARCEEFLQKRHDTKAAQKLINVEKRAKKRAAKERKQQLKKEEMERRAERERLREELLEQKKREKEEKIAMETAKEENELPVIKMSKKLPSEEIPIQNTQTGQKKKKDKSQELLSQEGEKEIVPESMAKKKKKKDKVESLPEGVHEDLMKKKKKKLDLEQPLQTHSNSAKRLPDLLLSQLSASDEGSSKAQLKKKRRAEEDLDIAKPQKKHKSAKENIPVLQKLNTPSGMFNVEPLKNPFSVQDAKLIRKAQVTKQFKREKQLKRMKSVQEPSVLFPRPTTSWTSTGVFHITDLQPQTRVVNTDAGVPMEFVVTTLEPKRKLGKKSTATSVFEAEAKKPVKGFKEAKLYGNGVVRESSTDLMHRKIKKKFVHK